MAEKNGFKQGLGVGLGLALAEVIFNYSPDEPTNWVRAIGLFVTGVAVCLIFTKLRK